MPKMGVDPHVRREVLKRLEFLQRRLSTAQLARFRDALAALDAARMAEAWPLVTTATRELIGDIARRSSVKLAPEVPWGDLAAEFEERQILSQRHLAMLTKIANPNAPTAADMAQAVADVLEITEWFVQASANPDDELSVQAKTTSMLRREELDKLQRQHEDTKLNEILARLAALDKRYAAWLADGDDASIDESRDLREAIAAIIADIEIAGITGRLADRLKTQREHLAVVDNWFEHLVYRLATRAFELVNDTRSAPADLAGVAEQIQRVVTAAPERTEKLRDYLKPLADALRLRFRDLVNRARTAPATIPGLGVMVEVERILDGLTAVVEKHPHAAAHRDEAAQAVQELIAQRLQTYQSHLGGAPEGLDGVPPLAALRRELAHIRTALGSSRQIATVDALLAQADAGLHDRLAHAATTVAAAPAGIDGFRPLIGVYRALEPARIATADTAHANTVAQLTAETTAAVKQRLGTVQHTIDRAPHDLDGFAQLAALLADAAQLAVASRGTDFAADAQALVVAVDTGMRARIDAVMQTPLPPIGQAIPALQRLVESLVTAERSLPADSAAVAMLADPRARAQTALDVAQQVNSVAETVERAIEQFDKGIESMQQSGIDAAMTESHNLLVTQLPDGYLGPVPAAHFAPMEREMTAIAAEREAFATTLANQRRAFTVPIDALRTAQLPSLGAADFSAQMTTLRHHVGAAENVRDAAKAALLDAAERGKEINKRAKFAQESAKSVALKLISALGLKSRRDAGKLMQARAQLIESIARRPLYGDVIRRLAENWAVPPLPEGHPDPRSVQVTGLTPQDGFGDDGGKAEINIVVLGERDAPYDAPFRPENFSLRQLKIVADGDPPVTVEPGPTQVVLVNRSNAGKPGAIVCALAMDCSGSLKAADPDNHRIDAAQRLILDLLKHPTLRLGLFTFHGSEFAQNHAFGRDSVAILSALEGVRGTVHGKTPLWYSIVNVCHDLSHFSDDTRRVLVLFTDGKNDTKITTTFEEARQAALDAGVQVFCVGLGRKFDARQVNHLCRVTRGTFARGTSEGLKELFAAIARAVVNSLTLTVELPLHVTPRGSGILAGRTLEIDGEIVIHPRPGVIVPSRFAVQAGI